MKRDKPILPLQALVGLSAFPHEDTGLIVLLLEVEDIDCDDSVKELLSPLLCSESLLAQLEEALPAMRAQLKRVKGMLS